MSEWERHGARRFAASAFAGVDYTPAFVHCGLYSRVLAADREGG